MGAPRNIVDVTWRSDLAYVIGLIVSDGNLHRDTARIGITSKDLEIVELFGKALGIRNKWSRHARGGKPRIEYYYLTFKSRQFYDFLLDIGITPAKSKTIKAVDVPDEFFPDFLRGVCDGDGTFWTHWDTRWSNSFVFHLALYSASEVFIRWIHQRLHSIYGTNGHIKKGAGVYEIRYAKGDSKKLFEIMYYNHDIMFLSRKYHKIKEALDFDQKIKQNAKHAVVAQW